MHNISGNGLVVRSWAQTQWAPTLTAHDPNPPIPLEDAISGSAAATLGAFSSNASGTVGAASGITGTSAQTLSNATATASGTVRVTGTSAQTLADASPTASGTVRVTGTSAQTLANATPTASGAVRVAGTSANTLADATSLADGVLTNTGSIGSSLDAFIGEGSGFYGQSVTGTGSITLDAFTSLTDAFILSHPQSITAKDRNYERLSANDRLVDISARKRKYQEVAVQP